MSAFVTKYYFLTTLQCSTQAWYQRNLPASPLTPSDELRILEGRQIGELAREQFSTGILVDDKNPVEAARRTKTLMEDPNVSVLFEAAFIAEPFVTRVDVLVRSEERWKLIEVKSATHKEDINPDYVDDMAYTTMVTLMAGVELGSVELMRLSKDWIGGGGDPFKSVDATSLVMNRAKEFSVLAPSVAAKILAVDRPEPILTTVCKGCDYFATKCLGSGVEYPIVEIPRISDKKLVELTARQIRDVREIPGDFELTETQRETVDSIKSGRMEVNRDELSKLLSTLSWPCYYLDFETAMSAIPLWVGVKPFEHVLTQYSLHISHDLNTEPEHLEYLAPHTHDARRELAERLIQDLGVEGSIVVYSSFESSRIKELAKLFPDLATGLLSLCDRLFDLEKVFKNAVSHPGFRGRTSIKVTLPTLVPEMSYKDLVIGEGGGAVAAFVRMVRGWCSDDEATELRSALLTYCKQDTLAMVKLHQVAADLIL